MLYILPLLGSSLIQQMYTTVDLIFVGHFLGVEASAAVGASDLLVTCLVGFFTGMAVGTSVFTAQYFGAKKYTNLHRLIQTVFLVGIVGGLILMVFGLIFAPSILRLMGTPEAIFEKAVVYIRIYMLSMMSIVTYNLLSGVIRALGDSRSPMLFQLFGGILNFAADFTFIVALHMGVAGTAAATFVSQTFAACLVVIYLCRLKTSYRLKVRTVVFDTAELKNVLKVGVPSGIQSIVITLSNIVIQSQINTLGVNTIAAYTVYFKTEMFLYLPVLSLGQGVVAFVGQNFGAKNYTRIKRGIRFCFIGGVVFILAFAAVLYFNASVVCSLFTTEAQVISICISIMGVAFPFYFLCALVECLSSNLRGYGQAIVPMLVTVISYCGFRLIILFSIMGRDPTAAGVALSYPISWSIAAGLLAVVTVFYRRRHPLRG